ncbi:MAG TPA: DUF21 domain-containing protein, partial [Opitutaceae bacterium]|nr:DUF21 domain-containing protein [Opitutaceae bacterium]
MFSLALAIVATLGISFVCSLFEAVVLSTTVADLEALKKIRPKRGRALETIKVEIDETISAILTLNTLANGVGSMIVGYLAGQMLTTRTQLSAAVLIFAVVLFAGAEVLPKNIGVSYRRGLQPLVVYPLWWLRKVLRPITWL